MKKIFIITTVLLVLFSGCDNLVDMSDLGYANIKIASDEGRYIAGGGSSIDSAILGFINQDVLYNFNMVENIENFTGEYLFTGLPVATYTFMAILRNSSDKIVSMAMPQVEIEEGLNHVIVEMGPGFLYTFGDGITQGEIVMDFTDLGGDYNMTFSGDEIHIGLPKEYLNENTQVTISTNAWDVEILDFDGSVSGVLFPSYTRPATELDYSTVTFGSEGYTDRYILRLTSFDTTSTIDYKLVFEEF